MEITLPENISEINLGKYIKYEELIKRDLDAVNFNRRKIALFTGIPFKDTGHLKQADYDRLINQIDKALTTDAEFTPTFTLSNIEFGFIPDLDKITIGEFADLSMHGTATESLHKLMAVLFRPVVNKVGDSYSIMPYNGTDEYADMMKGMPLNCSNGALLFFWSLANELQKATLRYLEAELLREVQQPTTSKILAGTPRLRNWLKTTYLKFRKSRS